MGNISPVELKNWKPQDKILDDKT